MRAALVLLAWSLATAAWSSGMSEDPSEKLTKTWAWTNVKTLEIRGQIDFVVRPGPEWKVTVTTSRALFDQLNVSNWWGAGAVVVESGLIGPREVGIVQLTVETPSVNSILVADRCSGQISWPGNAARLDVQDQSDVALTVNQGDAVVAASWRSHVTVTGILTKFSATLRHQAQVDTQGALVHHADIFLDEASGFVAGPTDKATGKLRHASRLVVLDPAPWTPVVLVEGSAETVQPTVTPP